MDTSLELVRRHVQAFNAGDADALLAVFDVSHGRIARAKIYREGSADA